MSCLAGIVLANVVAGCASGKDESTCSPIAIEDFLREPEKRSLMLSPDGTAYTYLQRVAGTTHLFEVSLDDGRVSDLSAAHGKEVQRYTWLPEGKLLLIWRSPEGPQVSVLDPARQSELVVLQGGESFEVLDILATVPGKVAVAVAGIDGKPVPKRLDCTTGALESVSPPAHEADRWIFDHRGALRCAIRELGRSNELLCRRGAEGRFRTVLRVDAVHDLFVPLVFRADNRRLIAYSNLDRERVALVVFDPELGREVEVLHEDPEYDLLGDDEGDHIGYAPASGGLRYVFYTTWKRRYHCFDHETRQTVAALERRFPERVIRLISSTPEWNRHLIKVSGDRLAGEYYLFDRPAGTFRFLASDCPWLEERCLSPKKPISFGAPDGRRVHGYLVLPAGIEPVALPTVVYPHGGPHWRDVWEMGRFREVQLLANRGYAVLLVNFRGSTGYGKSFLAAGFKQNGLAVQDDISAGVRYLIEQGIADPERVAIIGGSYGGYATLAGLVSTPELYACGVDLFGVSSLFTFLESLSRFSDMDVMYERIGHPVRDRDLLERTSPLLQVAKIRAPVLIAQGGRDPVVSRRESEQMVAALRERGVPVEYVYHEDEGHGYFTRDDNWLQLWRTIESFLERHLHAETRRLRRPVPGQNGARIGCRRPPTASTCSPNHTSVLTCADSLRSL